DQSEPAGDEINPGWLQTDFILSGRRQPVKALHPAVTATISHSQMVRRCEAFFDDPFDQLGFLCAARRRQDKVKAAESQVREFLRDDATRPQHRRLLRL